MVGPINNLNLANDPLLSLAGLKRESVLEQVHLSLSSLQTSCVDILYLHAPDHNTPIEETLSACQQLHQGGSSLLVGGGVLVAHWLLLIYSIPTKNDGVGMRLGG